MAYERDDRRTGWREEPRGFTDERGWRGRERGYGRERDRFGERDPYGGREERGFLERAGDEISSWFGDDEAERRRRNDQMMFERERQRDRDFEPRGRGDYGRHRGEDRTFRPMGWAMSDRDYQSGYDRSVEPRDYRPVTGDYSRGSQHEDRRDFGRASEWDRDDYRRTSFAGSSAGSQHEDPHYEDWRRRELDTLDRDYDEFRREHQARFDSDFADWRQRRQGKRQLLGRIREHMEVVGSDDQHVGTVDRIAGDRMILTRSDPDSEGVHHSMSCTAIDRVENDRVVLDMDSEEARRRWRDENRDRALFEREDQGEAGPGILNRSFSGTYR